MNADFGKTQASQRMILTLLVEHANAVRRLLYASQLWCQPKSMAIIINGQKAIERCGRQRTATIGVASFKQHNRSQSM
jgi:hypothetical protein